MAGKVSLKIGNWLYQNAFGVYNILYPIFKNRQDKNEIAFINKHLKPGFIVLDIGANIGFYSKILSDLAGENGKVHCFEPDTTNFNHLSANVRHLKNVYANNLAVSSSEDPIKIYLSNELNVDHRTYPVENYQRVLEIKATSIDHYLKDDNKVDFIKMDIQGYEIEALKGMKKTIADNAQIQIVMEFWPHGLKSAGFSVEALLDMLDEYQLSYQLMDNEIELNRDNIKLFEAWGQEQFTNLYAFKKD